MDAETAIRLASRRVRLCELSNIAIHPQRRLLVRLFRNVWGRFNNHERALLAKFIYTTVPPFRAITNAGSVT